MTLEPNYTNILVIIPKKKIKCEGILHTTDAITTIDLPIDNKYKYAKF